MSTASPHENRISAPPQGSPAPLGSARTASARRRRQSAPPDLSRLQRAHRVQPSHRRLRALEPADEPGVQSSRGRLIGLPAGLHCAPLHGSSRSRPRGRRRSSAAPRRPSSCTSRTSTQPSRRRSTRAGRSRWSPTTSSGAIASARSPICTATCGRSPRTRKTSRPRRSPNAARPRWPA
jgi:hypothetical protein